MKGVRLLRGAGNVSLGPPLTYDEIVTAVEAAERSPWCRRRRVREDDGMLTNSLGEVYVEVVEPLRCGLGGGALREELKSQAHSAVERAIEAVEALRSGETARVREWLAGLAVGDTVAVDRVDLVVHGDVLEIDDEAIAVRYGAYATMSSFYRRDGYAVRNTWIGNRIIPPDFPRAVAAFTRERVESLRREVATAANRCGDESRLREALSRLTIEV